MSRQRATMFARWAEQHRLVPHGHDAAYAGAMSGVRIAVESDNRVVRAAEELLDEQDSTRSVRIDDERVVLLYWQNVALEQIDEAVQRIIEAWRTLAPYR